MALTSGQPGLIGPYIDFGGADMKIVTASRPVLQEKRAVAAAGAPQRFRLSSRTGGGPRRSPVAPYRGPLIGRRRWLRFTTTSTSGGFDRTSGG
ncbi:hypothetical protein [Arthrobacter globiformis]|uniref:hypothetical protein n=1 Tax=Arthrobacter globiformis TaxID=1665 RepID=UPI00278B3F57|nr:hypothetical protein [Arthrobacter globiformis]MDQ0862886.1 hypothetical protein [Arthrobacter globiformis]